MNNFKTKETPESSTRKQLFYALFVNDSLRNVQIFILHDLLAMFKPIQISAN